MKKIVVHNCFDCPYSKNQYKTNKTMLICTYPETDKSEINNPNKIEKWCELEDEI